VNLSSQRRTILLVEDERAITEPLAEALEREGFNAAVAGTAAEAMEAAAGEPDLVLLDIGLPDGSGLDVCRELRKGSQVPIIMLTARGSEADRVAGLELGADDYIVKPFSAREVMARVRAVLRRVTATPGGDADGPIRIGELSLDTAKHEARLGGHSVELSRKEFELLKVLMENAGSVLTREALIDEVWDMNWFGSTKTLDVHISGLRKKLDDDPKDPRFIHTVRGVGFRFSGADEA
jgi:DNA-binding response OmpR family regulator